MLTSQPKLDAVRKGIASVKPAEKPMDHSQSERFEEVDEVLINYVRTIPIAEKDGYQWYDIIVPLSRNYIRASVAHPEEFQQYLNRAVASILIRYGHKDA